MAGFIEKLKKKGEKIEEEEEREVNLEKKEEEGELAINLYETENSFILEVPVGGVGPENLEIYLERDVLTILGERKEPPKEPGKYLIKECFFGKFKREVILPSEISYQEIKTEFKNGLLRIELPILRKEKKIKIKISQ